MSPLSPWCIVGSSNAVNLTDGLDGLAIGLVGIAATANAVIVYLGGNKIIADYLKILYIPGSGELVIFCGALLGASLGFLWYNAHPAEVFMGDVGSLVAWRRARDAGRRDQARAYPDHRGRHFCDGDGLGDPAGGVVQD